MKFQPALQCSVFIFYFFWAIKIALDSQTPNSTWWNSCSITRQNQPWEIVRGALSHSQILRGEGRVLTSDPCSYIDCSCLLWGDSDVSDGQGTASVYPYHRHFPPPLHYHQISYTTVTDCQCHIRANNSLITMSHNLTMSHNVYTLTKFINATLLFLPPFFMSWTQRSKTFSLYTKGLFLSNIVHKSV